MCIRDRDDTALFFGPIVASNYGLDQADEEEDEE